MSSSLSRREFLKLSSLLPFLGYSFPYFFSAPSRPAENPKAPNVLILLFDTLSAANVSLYGYPRETMPNLAKFAERATVYHNHFSPGNFTVPGTASLLTGTYPWTHRAFREDSNVVSLFENRNLFELFSHYYRSAYTHNPLADVFLRQFHQGLDSYLPVQSLYLEGEDFWVSELLINDYSVASISRSWILRKRNGYDYSLFLSKIFQKLADRREEHFEEVYGNLFPLGLPTFTVTGPFLLEDAMDWLTIQLDSLPKPFLSYIHLLPPHSPYRTRKEFIGIFNDGWLPRYKPIHVFSKDHNWEKLNEYRREYDEFIAYVDAEFGRLYDFMESTGILDDTLVIFTSDHGEMFERGILGHAGETLHQPLVHIPLLISQPGQAQRHDIYSNTVSIDVIPTLLHLTGQAIPDWLEGEILPPWREESQPDDRPVFALEAKSNEKYAPITHATAAIIKGNYKLAYYFGYEEVDPFTELYDIKNDPEEMHDLDDTGLRESLLQELLGKLDKVNEPYLK